MSLLSGPPATGADLARLALFVLSAIGIAAFGHIVNDAADQIDDVRAGKANPLVTWTGTQIWGAAFLAMCIGVGPWVFLDARPVARWFLLLETLLLLAYAVRPICLKHRGALGALTDAAYAYAVPLVWTLVVFAPPGPLPLGALAALAVWASLVGLRCILWHQIDDLQGDRRVGARTAAVRLGRERTVNLVAVWLLPVEVLAGLTLLGLVGLPVSWLPGAFSAYLVWRSFEVRYLWSEPLLPVALHDLPSRVRLIGFVIQDEFLARWLPLVVVTLLAIEDPWWWLAVAFVLVAFQNAARDVVGRSLWGVPDGLWRMMLDVRTWLAVRRAARLRRERVALGPAQVSAAVRASRRWVFVACGDDRHLLTLAVATEHLRALSSLEIWVVTDTARNGRPVDQSHVDRVLDVRTPEVFDHHQASIWLKTGLGELLPEGEWCYLDTDVIAVAPGAEEIFDSRTGPVAFASDLTFFGSCVDHFSTYAMTCSCGDQRTRCGHLRQQLEVRWGLEVPGRWLQWNGGVFVFGPEARPFLALWQERSVASFGWPEWRTRDQGALIATVWSMGLQELPRLARRFNFITNLANPDLSFDPDLGWAHHPEGPWVEPVFLHLYTSPLYEQDWDFGRDIEGVLIRRGADRLARPRAGHIKRRAKAALTRAWWALDRGAWAAWAAVCRAWWAVYRGAWAAWVAVCRAWWAVYRGAWAARRGIEFIWMKLRRTVRRLAPRRVAARLRGGAKPQIGSMEDDGLLPRSDTDSDDRVTTDEGRHGRDRSTGEARGRSPVHMPARTEAVDRGIAWLRCAQLPTGEFPSYAGWLTDPLAAWDPDQLNFITALSAMALDPVPSPEAAPIVDRAVMFLRSQREPGALWRYWSRDNERVAFTPLDADDTACCSMAVGLRGDHTRSNVSILRGLACMDGRYHTWLIPHDGLIPPLLRWRLRDERRAATVALRAELWNNTEAAPDDVDAVVNANVCRYLGPERALKGSIEWVASIVEAGWETGDKWHRSPYTLWSAVADGAVRGIERFEALAPIVIARIEGAVDDHGSVGRAIDTALALRAVQCFGGPTDLREHLESGVIAAQGADGAWPREVVYHGGPTEVFGWASEALTTALSVSALAAKPRPHAMG